MRKIIETNDFFSASRCLDIAGVASSILATPTIEAPGIRGFPGLFDSA